jgi:hypothetical protein
MSVDGDEDNEEEVVVSLLGGEHKGDVLERGGKMARATFGVELTNSPTKRGAGAAIFGIGGQARFSPSKLVRG